MSPHDPQPTDVESLLERLRELSRDLTRDPAVRAERLELLRRLEVALEGSGALG